MSAAGCGQSAFRRALELDDPGRVVDRDDRAGRLAGPRREGLIAGIEVVVLRLEPVAAMEHHAVALELVDEGQSRQRIALADQLLDRQVVLQLEPAPPLRLLLAPVPVEQIGQQAASLGVRRVVVGREVRGQARDPFLDGSKPIGDGRRRRLTTATGRSQPSSGQRPTASERRSSSQPRRSQVETQSSRL